MIDATQKHSDNYAGFWSECLKYFEGRLPPNEFNTWLRPIIAEVDSNGQFVRLIAPNRYIRDWVNQRYLPQIKKMADDVNLPDLQLVIQGAFMPHTIGSKPSGAYQTNINAVNAASDQIVVSNDVSNAFEDTSAAKLDTPFQAFMKPSIMERAAALSQRIKKRPVLLAEESEAIEKAQKEKNQSEPVAPFIRVESVESETPAQNYGSPAAPRLNTETGLSRQLTFETLVKGKANELACSAAEQVYLHPGVIYNPLFIYGATSLGKTHLMQAIGNRVAERHPEYRIRYIESESFYREYSRAIGRNNIDEFKRHFHSLDFFLIDDIQFLGKKFGTQDEFFHTFNTLLTRQKQIIITSDTYPKDIKDLKERVVSRFGGGLTVMLEPPELEMRVDILHKKAASPEINLVLSDEAAFFMARHIRSNARELEGALNKVKAFVTFTSSAQGANTVTIDIVREALNDILFKHHALITVESIQKTVADYYRIKVSDLYSKSRQQKIARPRQISMALARELTQYSLPHIGETFGGRDHTTVLHACKTVEKLRNQDPEINHDYHVLRQTIKGADD